MMPPISYKKRMEDFEKNLIEEALYLNKGSITKTAEDFGYGRHALYRRMKRLGVSRFLCLKCKDHQWVIYPPTRGMIMCNCHPMYKKAENELQQSS